MAFCAQFVRMNDSATTGWRAEVLQPGSASGDARLAELRAGASTLAQPHVTTRWSSSGVVGHRGRPSASLLLPRATPRGRRDA